MILHHGLQRMVEQQDNVFFYLTLLNENYPMPGLKPGTEEQIIKGMYLLQEAGKVAAKGAPLQVNLLGSGSILRESIAAKELLERDWGVAANVWSCPSFNQLGRDGQDAERWNLLHPTETPRVPFVAQQLEPHPGPVVASTDYVKDFAEQIRAFLPRGRTYQVLGTDGFGRSDFRIKLREHFEINRHYIIVAALKSLADEGKLPQTRSPRRSASTRSTPTRSIRSTPERRFVPPGGGPRAGRRQELLEREQMAVVEVKVPDIGDFKEVEVIELLVKPGDAVAVDQSLITVESDKASMEIPSSQAGVVKALQVKLGDKVGEGSTVLLLETDGGTRPAQPAETTEPASPPALAAAESAGPPPRPAGAPERPQAGGVQPQTAVAATPPAAATGEPQPPAASAATTELVVPDIGDFDEVSVIEVFIKPGDAVKVEQSLVTVESDKASMEIPSAHAGVVKEVRVRLGDKVSKGSVLATVQATGRAAAPGAAAAASAAPPAAATAVPATPAAGQTAAVPIVAPAAPAAAMASPPAHERIVPTAALPPAEPPAPSGVLPHASPSIRKLARELGVPLAEVKGSGPKGRITQQDVQGFVKGVMAGSVQTAAQAAQAPAAGAAAAGFPGLLPWPQVDFAKYGPVERRELARIRKISAANLHRNWVLIPHVTNHDDADVTELEAFRVQTNKEHEKSGIKVTMLAFLIKACVAALKQFPEFNASLDGEQLVLKRYYHIGFAADTPNGLVVPVIKDADQKGVLQLSQEMSELAKKARDGKLGPADMSGGCFSISSLGGIGGRYFTPIINAPEVAILGVSRSSLQPVWDGHAFQPRLLLPLSLSYDHRVIDGAVAARFNAYLCAILADFRRVLL